MLLLLLPAPASISLPPSQVDSTSCCPPHPVPARLTVFLRGHPRPCRIASHRIESSLTSHGPRVCSVERNKLSQLALLHFTYYAAAAAATAASAPTSHGRLSTPWHQPASPAAGTGPSWLRWPAGQPAAAHAAARACPRHHPTEHEPNPDCHQLALVGRGHVPHERRRLGLHPAPRRA